MDKVDRSLGRELRRRRMANGDTLDSLAAKIRVADKTIGKWERGEVMPSATNIRSLEMLGLIEEWLDRNGSGAKQYPTIEMRICDVCTRLDDAVSIAALYANLISWLARKDRERALPSEPLTELIAENRWIAQRYGVFAFFGDQAPPGGRVDIQDFLEELVGELAADARALDCETEMRHALSVVKNGTAADRQLDLYRLRRLEGDSEQEALLRVVDLALAETRDGLDDGRG